MKIYFSFILKTNCNTHMIGLSNLHYLLVSSRAEVLSCMLPAVDSINQYPAVEGCVLNGQVGKTGGHYYANSGKTQKSHGRHVNLQ